MNTKIIKAVADATRLKLLAKIGKGAICACALPGYVNKSQPAVSQHLRILLDAGLVKVKKEGVRRVYSLSQKGAAVLEDISRW